MTNTSEISLYDSETNDHVTADELGLTDDEYDAACVTSMNDAGDTGHIRVYGTKCGTKGRRVYAQ